MTGHAVHVGGGLRSSADAVRRLGVLCAAAGIGRQTVLSGDDATVGAARRAVAAAGTGPGGRLVLTFSGHAERAVPDVHLGGWRLHDGVLRHVDTAALLSAMPASACVVVVADTCYAASFAAVLPTVPAATVLLAACGVDQSTLDYPVSGFAAALGEFVGEPDYVSLRERLRRDTPDAERPEVSVNRPEMWRWRPFAAPYPNVNE